MPALSRLAFVVDLEGAVSAAVRVGPRALARLAHESGVATAWAVTPTTELLAGPPTEAIGPAGRRVGGDRRRRRRRPALEESQNAEDSKRSAVVGPRDLAITTHHDEAHS